STPDRQLHIPQRANRAAADHVGPFHTVELDHFAASAFTTTAAPALTSGRSSETTTNSPAESPAVISVKLQLCRPTLTLFSTRRPLCTTNTRLFSSRA